MSAWSHRLHAIPKGIVGRRAVFWRRLALLAACTLAAGGVVAGMSWIGAGSTDEAAPSASSDTTTRQVALTTYGFGSSYDLAAARLTRLNHLLEARQAELDVAVSTPGSASVAVLRGEVARLERSYARAVGAMANAFRPPAARRDVQP